jgi:rhomboid protease GluP
MPQGSRVCTKCGRLNAAEDKVCYNCGQRLPGPVARSALGFLADFSEDGLPVTKIVAGLCIVVYVLSLISDRGFDIGGLLSGPGALSALLRFGILYKGLAWAEPWRFLSAVFMHFGLLHIGMNLLSLVNLGRTLEPHFGSARFAILYVVAGVLGFVGSQVWYEHFSAYQTSPPTAGASGAIFGLLGAFIGVLWARRHPNWGRMLVNYLVYAAILGWVFPANNAAHISGFAVGVVVGALFEREPNPRRRDGLMRVLAGICLLCCALSVVLSASSPVWKQVREYERAESQGHGSTSD